MFTRRIWIGCLGVALAVALVGCGGDDDEPEADATTTTTAAVTTTDPTGELGGDTEPDDPTTTEGSTTTGPTVDPGEPITTDDPDDPDDPDGPATPADPDVCAAYQEIADATDAIDALGEDWPAIQAAYPGLAADIVAALDRAAGLVDDPALAADLEVMSGLIAETAELVATSTGLEQFVQRVGEIPGSEEADASADRVEDAAEDGCDVDI